MFARISRVLNDLECYIYLAIVDCYTSMFDSLYFATATE